MKRHPRTDIWLLAGLVALGLVTGRLQTMARNRGDSDPLTAVVRSLLTPGSHLFAMIGHGIANSGDALVEGRRRQSENQRLRALEASAATYQADVDRLQSEVEELRKVAGWAPARKTKISADVIGYFPLESRITLDVGAAAGVKRGQPVVTYEGLVGRIETVDAQSSQALLSTAPGLESRITALVQRAAPNPAPAGVIRGEGPNALRLELADPTASIDIGDRVVTSGFSKEIPRGIVIGRIVSVQDDPAFGKRTALVFPAVAIGRLREVVVLK